MTGGAMAVLFTIWRIEGDLAPVQIKRSYRRQVTAERLAIRHANNLEKRHFAVDPAGTLAARYEIIRSDEKRYGISSQERIQRLTSYVENGEIHRIPEGSDSLPR
jgi:ribosomal protein L15E